MKCLEAICGFQDNDPKDIDIDEKYSKQSSESSVICSKTDALNIIHFNDVYNIEPTIKKGKEGNIISSVGGVSKFQTIINKFQTELGNINKPPIILFSGDFLSPSSIGSITSGLHMIDIMNNVGITCSCIGNHDLDYGNEALVKVIKQLNYPVVNTNILTYINNPQFAQDEKNNLVPAGKALKSYVLQYDQLIIGILGISENWTVSVGIKPEHGFVYKPFIEECQKHVDELNKDNDINLMIVLTHSSTPSDMLLAENIKGVDLILGGHNHIYFAEIQKSTKTVVVKSGSDFKNVSWIQLQLIDGKYDTDIDDTTAAKKIQSNLSKSLADKKQFIGTRFKYVIRHYNIDNKISPDPATDKLVSNACDEFNKATKKVIGTLGTDLDATFKTIRSKESNAGNFITDVIRRLYNCDGVVLNSGSIRADRVIPCGDVTFGDILDLVPFSNAIVVIKIAGSTINKILEHGVAELPDMLGGFPQMSGIKMQYDINHEPGNRIIKSWIIDADHEDDHKFELIEEDKIYSIGMNAHMAKGNGGRDFLKTELIEYVVEEEEGIPCYTILRNFFTGINTVNDKLMNESKTESDNDDNLMERLGRLKPTKSSLSVTKFKRHNESNRNVLTISPSLRNSILRVDEGENKSSNEMFAYGSTADKSNYYLKGKQNNEIEEKKSNKEYNIDRNTYINKLSNETKMCISATHLFGTIWKNYFQDEENQCEYMKQDSNDRFEILDHILVRGGCNRDVLWGKNFNDVDAAVNTRELNKLHLLHLKKYHSTKETQENSNCILWVQYAKKFDDFETTNETISNFDDDKTGAKIIKSNYMLNAKFLLDILQNDRRVKDKLSVAIMGRTKRVWNIRIINKLMYNGYDLTGFDFDFLDIKHGIFALPEDRDDAEKIHKKNRMQSQKKLQIPTDDNNEFRAMYSIRIQSKLKIFQDLSTDYTAKTIYLPIYPLIFVNMSRYSDLTVNSIIIHMTDILKDQFGDYGSELIDFDWRSKVKNATLDIDGINDCKNKNIKVWGQNINDITQVLKIIHPKYHIFRMVKMWIKMEGKGVIDPKLIEVTIQLYPKWFSVDLFNNNNEYCQEMANRFISDYAKKGQYQLRFQCFEMVKFNSLCKEVINNVPNFKKYVNDAIENIQDNEMKSEINQIMKQYGYVID